MLRVLVVPAGLEHTVSATQTVSERCLRRLETSVARSRIAGGGKEDMAEA